MADIVSEAVRSRMMASIRAKDTKPELEVRRALFARGLRFRLHVATLPGRPDLVFRQWDAVVFVDGCFWHRHGCHLSKLPSTNTAFWEGKLDRNRSNDAKNASKLHALGWRVFRVWECSLRGATSDAKSAFFDTLARSIRTT
jgi:DNA mismatch endonuclease (patch repair protein)